MEEPENTSEPEEVVVVVEATDAQAAEGVPVEGRQPVIGEDHTTWEAFRKLDFWLLFVSFLCGVGTSLAVMNNLEEIARALGYADAYIFMFLASISGFFTCILSGSVQEYFIKKVGMPRPVWDAASKILMVIGYIVMAMALPGSLYIGSIIVGICYEICLVVTILTAYDLFGLKCFGTIHNILLVNLPLSCFLFSGLLARILYNVPAKWMAGCNNACIGAHCYGTVFVVMAIACVIGFGLDVSSVIRTKSIYAKIHSSKSSEISMRKVDANKLSSGQRNHD
ncbi:hypothetical protein U1Q18_022388 [Sarracenia purpurea var. burkii]